MKSRAWAYVRWSSKKQEKGDSLERQTKAIEYFKAKFPDVELVETFKDEGLSAYHGLNSTSGQLKHILDHITDETIRSGDYLIVESIDRISRADIDKATTLIANIKAKGILIYTTIDNHLYGLKENAFQDYILLGVIAQRAHDESKTKSERAKSAHAKKAKDAEEKGLAYSLKAPFGFRIQDGKYVIEPDEANEIRQLFALLRNKGLKQTVIHLNGGKTMKQWTVAKIEHLIKKEYVTGNLLIDKVDFVNGVRVKVHSKKVKDYYPAIVDSNVFKEVKKALAERATLKNGKGATTHNNIFQKVLTCEVCGENLFFGQVPNRNATKNMHSRYYYCKNKLTHKCGSNHIAFEVVFYEFCDFLVHLKGVFEYEHSSDVDEWESRSELFKALSFASRNKQPSKAFQAIEAQYVKAKDVLDGLNESVAGLSRIPKVVMEKLTQAEDDTEALHAKYQAMVFEEEQKKNLDLLTVDKLRKLIATEEGRIELNAYFKILNLKFSFKIDDEADILFVVMKDDKMLYHATGSYPKIWHKSRATAQIERYGFDVNDLF